MTPHTWTGNGVDDNWGNPANWCGTISGGQCLGDGPRRQLPI